MNCPSKFMVNQGKLLVKETSMSNDLNAITLERMGIFQNEENVILFIFYHYS